MHVGILVIVVCRCCSIVEATDKLLTLPCFLFRTLQPYCSSSFSASGAGPLTELLELTDEDFLWPLGREGIWILGLENLTVAIKMSNDSHAKD